MPVGVDLARRLRRVLARLACQRGFSLVEVLVTSAMALAVLTPTTALIVSAQRDSTRIVTKAETVQLAQVGLRGMVQELDQAYEVEYPTSTASTGCGTETAGVQACNIADVLVRLTSTGQSGTDFEVRYDCTVPSTTVTGDQSCWRYLCSATASTAAGSTCTASSSTLLTKKLVIDDLINGGSTTNAVFSFCYPNAGTTGAACTNGATRPTSATVTIEVPASNTLSTAAGGDPSTVELTSGLYMTNLDLDQ